MDPTSLVAKLNGYPPSMYPPWWRSNPVGRSSASEAMSSLSEIFRRAGLDERVSIADSLSESAKYLLSFYSLDKANEGLQTGSRDAIMDGLVPVVMAGGRSDTRTGGHLLTLLLNSAEKAGLDGRQMFAEAADLAINKESEAQIREFPFLPPKLRDIARFGYREIQTADGLIYAGPGEWAPPRTWWDKLFGRRRKNKHR